MKVPKKGAFMITITIIFLLLKCYVVCQWCISWKLRQISNSEIKLAVFPALHIFRSGLKNIALFFFARKLLNQFWRVLGGFLVLTNNMSISFRNLKYEMDHTCYLINSAILSVNFFMFTFRTNFLLLFHGFQKRKNRFCRLQWKINII